MTLDLRAFSRTGGWFATAPSANVNWEVMRGQGFDGDVDYELSELTLTRTLKSGGDIELEGFETKSKRESTHLGGP